MTKGLVVPDNPTPENWKYVPLYVPDDPQWLGIITGLLYSPCNGYWWRKNSGNWEEARDTACRIASQFVQDNFCEQVDECLIGSTVLDGIINDAIRDQILGNSGGALGQGIPSLDSCSPDHIFGAVTELVDYMNTVIIDVLELLESLTNVLEAVNIWADNRLPVSGFLASKLIEAIDWIISTVSETYSANYTSALRDEYRCEIFCLWQDSPNCTLSANDVAEYFSSKVGGFPIFAPYQDVIEYLVGEVWLGNEIPNAMHFLLATALTAGEAIGFFEITGVRNFETAIALGANNPDPDWSILCECANAWCYNQNFALDNGGYVVVNRGTYSSGVGWVNGIDCGVWVGLSLASDANVTRVEINYDLLNVSPDRTARILLRRDGATIATLNLGTETGVDLNDIKTGDWNIDQLWINIDADAGTGCTLPNPETVVIHSIELSGTGANPFGSDNC